MQVLLVHVDYDNFHDFCGCLRQSSKAEVLRCKNIGTCTVTDDCIIVHIDCQPCRVSPGGTTTQPCAESVLLVGGRRYM